MCHLKHSAAAKLDLSRSCSVSVLARATVLVVVTGSCFSHALTAFSENFPRMLLNMLVSKALVSRRPVREQGVGYSRQMFRCSSFLPQQCLGGVQHTVGFILTYSGGEKAYFGESMMSIFLTAASLLLFKRQLGLDLILAPKFSLTLAMKQWWKWWEILGHKGSYSQGWNRSQKVHFAPELFKVKSFIRLFSLTELEMYEAVKNKLRCNAVSVTMLVEFRYDWEKEFVSLVAENCLFYKVP